MESGSLAAGVGERIVRTNTTSSSVSHRNYPDDRSTDSFQKDGLKLHIYKVDRPKHLVAVKDPDSSNINIISVVKN